MESANLDRPTARDRQDARSRCLVDGYLPEHLEGLTDEEMESLLDYEDGSTVEECAARLPTLTIWENETSAEEIAAHCFPPTPSNPSD